MSKFETNIIKTKDDIIILNVTKIHNVMPLKDGMIGKAIEVILSCENYVQSLYAYRYVQLLYKNYNLSYSQLMFLYDVYVEQYNKIM